MERVAPQAPIAEVRPGVIWITGLSGVGKTTVARATGDLIHAVTAERPVLLDGDMLRRVLPTKGYSRSERLELARSYSTLAAELAAQGHVVVCSTISLFHEIHDRNRTSVTRYLEVLLSSDLTEIRPHDVRRVYSPDAAGAPVVGIDIEPEFPVAPDLRIDALQLDPSVVAEQVLRAYTELVDG